MEGRGGGASTLLVEFNVGISEGNSVSDGREVERALNRENS